MASLVRSSASGLSMRSNNVQPLKQRRTAKIAAGAAAAQENVNNGTKSKGLKHTPGGKRGRARRALGDISNRSSAQLQHSSRKAAGPRRALANISNGRSQKKAIGKTKKSISTKHAAAVDSKATVSARGQNDLDIEFTYKGAARDDKFASYDIGLTASDMMQSLQHGHGSVVQELGLDDDDDLLVAGFDDVDVGYAVSASLEEMNGLGCNVPFGIDGLSSSDEDSDEEDDDEDAPASGATKTIM